jgi:hypothetical protein
MRQPNQISKTSYRTDTTESVRLSRIKYQPSGESSILTRSCRFLLAQESVAAIVPAAFLPFVEFGYRNYKNIDCCNRFDFDFYLVFSRSVIPDLSLSGRSGEGASGDGSGGRAGEKNRAATVRERDFNAWTAMPAVPWPFRSSPGPCPTCRSPSGEKTASPEKFSVEIFASLRTAASRVRGASTSRAPARSPA